MPVESIVAACAWGAALTVAGMGLCGIVHLCILSRLDRPGIADRAIAVFGLAVTLVVCVVVGLSLVAPTWANALLLVAAPAWVLGVGFVVFLVVASLVHLWRPKAKPRCVVVLGAALRGQRPSPLLARRVAQGAVLWRSLAPGARIVVSGGQGRDEIVTEARAMAQYLIDECAVPASVIVEEDRSTSTIENLRYTLDLVGHESGPFVVVTSEYHVPRTRLLMLGVGMRGVTAASHSRPSYRPGALVREYLAGVVGSKSCLTVLGAAMVCGTALAAFGIVGLFAAVD